MLKRVCSRLSDRTFLRCIGLGGENILTDSCSQDSYVVVREDEMATHMGKLFLSLISKFLTRELWRPRRWPIGLVRLPEGEEQAQCAVDLLLADYERFQLLRKRSRRASRSVSTTAARCSTWSTSNKSSATWRRTRGRPTHA